MPCGLLESYRSEKGSRLPDREAASVFLVPGNWGKPWLPILCRILLPVGLAYEVGRTIFSSKPRLKSSGKKFPLAKTPLKGYAFSVLVGGEEGPKTRGRSYGGYQPTRERGFWDNPRPLFGGLLLILPYVIFRNVLGLNLRRDSFWGGMSDLHD